jgi:hypothetical protein
VNLPTPEGVTPILTALDNGHHGIARLLLERGGNPHLWDVYGRTALYIAVGNAGATGALLRVGAADAPLALQVRGGRGGAPTPGAGGRGGRGAGGTASPATSGPQVSAMEIINLLLAAGVDTNPQLNMRRPSNQGGRFNDPLSAPARHRCCVR